MKQLAKEGVGTVRKQAEPLTCEQEDVLACTVFWYNCNLLSAGSRLGTIDEATSSVQENERTFAIPGGIVLNFNIGIRESVDSLCRDVTDTHIA